MSLHTIISYNVNGIRAAMGKGLAGWIRETGPDIVCFQETKAQPDQIPSHEFEELGYHCYWYSAEKKGYSGVGIMSKQKPDKVVYGMGIPKYDAEGRVIRADFGDLSVISVYHPNGTSGEERQAFKMTWLDDFLNWANELRKERPNLIISGDYNIAHTEIDIHNPKSNAKNSGFLPEEREWVTKFLSNGYIDSYRAVKPDTRHEYSWWSFRFNSRAKNLGWRIDYHMVSKEAAGIIKDAAILMDVMHSDHCPIVLKASY